MSTEQTNFNWDDVEAVEETEDNRPFLNFIGVEGDLLVVALKFEESGAFHISKDNYGNDKFIFRVKNMEGNPHLFSTSSKRCMMAIKSMRPLTDKAVQITRTGQSFDTSYEAEEI